MKSIFRFLFVALSVFTSTNPLSAQWVQTNGPYGGNITSFAISGDNIFAGTGGGGIYLSSNNGSSWSPVNTGLSDWDVRTIAASGNNIFAGTGGGAFFPGGVYLSTNNGSSWALVFSPHINPGILSLAINGNYVFAGTTDGLYISTNNGLNWSPANTGGFSRAYAFIVKGTNIFAGTSDGIYLSTDNGLNWTQVNSGLPTNLFVSTFTINGNNIFAGDYSRGVYLSTDNGSNWSRINNGLSDTSVYALTSSGNNIYAGTSGGDVFISTDNGSNWNLIDSGLPVNQVICSLTSKESNIFAGTFGKGVFVSTNNGSNWSQVNNGLNNSAVLTLATKGNNMFAGTDNYLGIFLSIDNGLNWSSVNNGLPANTIVRTLSINKNNIFAGTNSGIYHSTNNGTNWDQLNSGLTGVTSFAYSENNIIVGTNAGIYISTDNGLSWNQTFYYPVPAIKTSPNGTGGSNIFAATTNVGVYLSTDNGLNWSAINNGLPNSPFSALAISGNDIYVGTAGGGNGGGGGLVFRSTNNGLSWSSASHGLPMINSINEFAVYGNNIFAVTSGGQGMGKGAYLSTDKGLNWASVNTGSLSEYWAMNFPTITISGTNLFIGTTGSGVWRRPVAEMIPTNSIIYPKFTFNTALINAGQSITISGYDFKSNGTANINIYGDNGFSQTISNISIDAQSSFTYNFVTAASMPLGLYNVQVTDNTTGLTTPARSFTLNTATVQTAYLNITYPTQTFTMNANEGLVIEWKDKMIKGANYPLIGSQRNYKYTIELSDNNGSTWQTLGTIAGQDYIDSRVDLRYYPTITTPGSSYKIRITDFYNNSNSQTTPVFTVNSNTYTGNLQVNLNWDYSYNPQPSVPVAGIAADGTARIFLNLSKINSSIGPNITSVSVTLNDVLNGIDPAKLGKVKVATQTSSYSLEANGIQSITDVDNTPNKSNYIFWYVAPDDFAGADPEDIKNGSRFVTATFTVHYDNNTTEPFTKHIIIVRPPLALVHGLASDPSAWNNFTFTAPNGLPLKYLDSKNFLFKVVSALTILPDAHFNTNAKGLITPNSSMPLSQTNTLQGVIDSMRDQGYAANQVDYVAHSMGGNVMRQATLFTDAFKVVGTLASSPYKNYEMGFVHKIITLNTPHNGSPWADLITQMSPYFNWFVREPLSNIYRGNFSKLLSCSIHPIGNYNNITLSYDQFEASDAIKDLETSDPGVKMVQTNIPSHLIAGDVFLNSSTIGSTVWNEIDQKMPYFTGFINYYWETIRALETDQGKKAQLNVLKSISSDAERAVKFLDYYISEYLNTPNFVLHGDFVVPLISQTAGSQTAGRQTSDPNVDVYSGPYAWHLDITQDLEVGDRVLQLINSPVGGPLFNNIPASSNTSALNKNSLFKKSSIQSSAAMISAIDTTKIKILSPTNFSNYTTDSTLIIKTQIKDTAGLQYVELYFQGKNYLTDSINSFINFNVQVKGDFLENQQIVATAVYDVTDTSKFLSDTVDVNVSIVQPVQSFTASPEMIFLLKNQTIYPDYYATYSTFVTKVGNNNSKIKVTINDPNIVSQDLLLLGFTGKNDGETFAVIEYGGFSYTLYFVVGGTASILPVELTSFTASTDSDKILLNWQTATEVNNYGFDVERRIIEKTEWSKIAFIQGNGTSNIPHNYSYTDHSLTSGSYVYRLKQIDNNGKIKYSQETEVTFKVPRVFALSQNYPNPFNPTTVINYQLPVNSFVTLKIYDVLGREIATLINGKQNAGYYKASFNASSLSSGVYFYRLQAGSFTETKKLILLR
jgi:photosystem II stability/assembly factor-like uncharacterized protein/pimeloyl-ACP methyl ester carboxylesterase